MKILTLLVALVGLLPMLAQGFWKMPCYGTVVRERIDPVLSPGAVSDHVQRVVGGSGINFTMDFAATRQAGCSSCTVKQDKSSYLVPQLYSVAYGSSGPIYTSVQDGGVNITYTQIRDISEAIKPFPEGLTMVAGVTSRRSSFGDDVANAISFRCNGTNVDSPNMPEHCITVVASVSFPSCWDGYNVTSDDFPHMSYDKDGKCPSTHPVRVMTLRYDFEFDSSNLRHPRPHDQLIFSTGDTTGYGFQGVFVNGWDTRALQTAIDTCTDSETGDIATTCPALTQYDADQCMDCKVPGRVDEPIDQVAALPSCHPISNGIGKRQQDCSGAPPPNITDYQTSNEDLTDYGWQYEGCSTSGDPFGMGGNINQSSQGLVNVGGDPSLTPAWCMSRCKEYSNTTFAWFALHAGQCICSVSDPKPETLPVVGFLGNCDAPCPGNGSLSCGGLDSTSLYRSCADSCTNCGFAQWPSHPAFLSTRSVPVVGEANASTDKDATLAAIDDAAASTVLSARLESPNVNSPFIGYKVCARTLNNTLSCTVVQGPRAESVAAAFIDWAIAEYALDHHGNHYHPSSSPSPLEDVLDARIAQLRLAELRRLRPRVMGADAVLAVALVSCICLLGLAFVAKQHEACGAARRVGAVQGDLDLATRLLDMDPAVLEMLFAKYAAIKESKEKKMKDEDEAKRLKKHKSGAESVDEKEYNDFFFR
ncbi:hypothetical protein BK809_0007891 [Diplodia seriata]|uniref:WSC domain-containing protein n=1 Tax=Diplodia seriata TaxID=420778 RepID=A0A1S8BJX0_9PEZI|nr:hypothetical protein BK809_0007891 [Diplodia seriata]